MINYPPREEEKTGGYINLVYSWIMRTPCMELVSNEEIKLKVKEKLIHTQNQKVTDEIS